jgi:hypothetical protein
VIRRSRATTEPGTAVDGLPSTLGRRHLLTGGLAVIGSGVLASQAAPAFAEPRPVAPADRSPSIGVLPGAITLTLRGSDWRRVSDPPPVSFAGGSVAAPGPTRTIGRFVDAGGATIGSFNATPIGASSDGPQLHTLALSDGVLLGLGDGPMSEAEYAVIGGTGRYLGAVGGYLCRQFPLGTGAGTAEFVLTLLLAEARDDAALGAAPTSSTSRS